MPRWSATWTKRGNSQFAYAPVKRGAIGKIKNIGGKDLTGKLVRYVGKIKGTHFVCLIQTGETFIYQLNWVDWE